ncbi:DUF4259 domain-containing protein [Anaerocolumna aminovalerica]|uniref:DUF4259 domain-containing protein n=1 Tax=Anaerocolumna aminovalerica TaxID=1527 RepID=UPI001FA929B7|nr:DUF4259 domain-containing protein [Anaerocolumna aminovalerica]
MRREEKIMGCWGITAFESDTGLDSVALIRKNLPEDGKLDLGKIIEVLQKNKWSVPDATDGYSHSGPMVLAEIMIKFIDQDVSFLGYYENWAEKDNKFSSITSFTASKKSIGWLRDYISDTLKYAKENVEFKAEHATNECDKQGGWFKESDWHDWQNHMSALIRRMDIILVFPENQIDLCQPLEQENGPIMGQSF